MTQVHTFRLSNQQDLKIAIADFCKKLDIKAGIIISGVGSLKTAHLRLADQKQGRHFQNGSYEITSITGTCSVHGMHVHIAIADSQGITLGGHLLEQNYIHTTAEICILEVEKTEFKREVDPQTGYLELVVKSLS